MARLPPFPGRHRRMRSYWINRSMCSVLEEMRDCYKTRNFAALLGLIEEAQSMGNKMESALSDKRDIKEMHEEWSELKAKIKAARKEVPKEEAKDD